MQCRNRKLAATLALLQLENFYEIRNWVGVSEANLLLSDIAQLIRNTLPERVLLCRCHNYEFAVLLIADCSVNARHITDKLKPALLSAVSPSLPRQLELKCAIGLAKLEASVQSWPVIFARARHSLSLAHHRKALPANLEGISADAALRQLRAALESTELELNYQAMVHLDETVHEHYEVRCNLSSQETCLPTVLLFETAAQNAMGEQIDRRIIEQVIVQLVDSNNPELRLVLNLSLNSLVSIDFLRWLEELLADQPELANQLIFQISEIDALVAQHHLITFCEAVARIGSRISLSNFGCTPKPLGYLSLVPASYVKLDISQLSKIEMSVERMNSVKSLVDELHQKRIKVVAPLIENPSVLPLLWEAKVDFFQGNRLHKANATLSYRFVKTFTLDFD